MGRLQKLLRDTKGLRETLVTLFTDTAMQSHPNCKSSARGCYMVNATTEMANACPETLKFVADNREQFVGIMADALASAQVQGKLEEQSDPVELANFLFLSYNGMQVVVQTNIDRKVLVKAVRRSVDFYRGFSALAERSTFLCTCARALKFLILIPQTVVLPLPPTLRENRTSNIKNREP